MPNQTWSNIRGFLLIFTSSHLVRFIHCPSRLSLGERVIYWYMCVLQQRSRGAFPRDPGLLYPTTPVLNNHLKRHLWKYCLSTFLALPYHCRRLNVLSTPLNNFLGEYWCVCTLYLLKSPVSVCEWVSSMSFGYQAIKLLSHTESSP